MNSDCFILNQSTCWEILYNKNLHKNYLFFVAEKNRPQIRLAFQIARRSLAAEAASSKFSLASCASTAVVGGDARGGTKHAPGRQVEVCEGSSFFSKEKGCLLKSMTVIKPSWSMEKH